MLFAVACGTSIANLYYAQPVLHSIAAAFRTSSGTAGLLVTFGQIGFVLGLMLLVPLGDLLPRRRLVPIVLVATTLALLATAVAPGVGVLIALALFVGLGSVVAQLLVPMAASLADEEHRGAVVGTVMSGLLVGILLSRTLSGLVAGAFGWRTVYWMAAALTSVTAIVLARLLPGEEQRPHIGYRALLAGPVGLLRTEPVLRRRAGYGALGFAAFSVFWTTLAFLLGGAPFHYGDLTIGLFGLVGAGGALCANAAGRWADRELTRLTTLVFALCIAVSFLPLWYGRHSVGLLILGILILDVGVQGLQVTNQSIIYKLVPHARSRVTSAYMLCYFVGGAAGSAGASALYDSHRWAGVCLLGAATGIAATICALRGVRVVESGPRLRDEGVENVHQLVHDLFDGHVEQAFGPGRPHLG